MKKLALFMVFLFFGMTASAQLPSKVKKMEGTWEYKFRSGFEVMEIREDELIGRGYRVHRKSFDTSCVETTRIRLVGKTLIYSMSTYSITSDSVTTTVYDFVGDGKKLKFQNISAPSPYAIRYSFGFFNKNKLNIRIYIGPETKPIKLQLLRKKED